MKQDSGVVFMSATYARALLATVADQRHDPSLILVDELINAADIAQLAQIDAAVFGRMYQRAIILLNDESLGLVSGGPVVTGTFRMMCLCVIHRPCLRSIVRRAGEFLDVCSAVGVKPDLLDSNGQSCIGFAAVVRESRSIEQILHDEHPIGVRTSLYLWHSLLSWFAGRNLPMREVVFDFDEPERLQSWQEIFRCPIRFNGERAMLCFEQGVLDSSNVQNEQALSVFLKSTPYRLIVPSYHDHKLSDRVLALLGDDYTQSLPSAEEVSRQLGVSVSTLRRQLKEEGSSFQTLKDECRRAAALQYLASNDLSLAEVSGLLGFDETSAFFRAFKRWTGQTPSQYRESL